MIMCTIVTVCNFMIQIMMTAIPNRVAMEERVKISSMDTNVSVRSVIPEQPVRRVSVKTRANKYCRLCKMFMLLQQKG